jgi:hypothetical protein
VGGGKLGAFAVKMGISLEVGDTAVEVKVIALECGKFGSMEGGNGIALAANGLAKVESPGGELSSSSSVLCYCITLIYSIVYMYEYIHIYLV